MAKHRITETMPHDCPGTLVFWWQRSWQILDRVIQNRGANCRWDSL